MKSIKPVEFCKPIAKYKRPTCCRTTVRCFNLVFNTSRHWIETNVFEVTMARNAYQSNVGTGSLLQPKNNIGPLSHNLQNIKVGGHKKGTREWKDTAVQGVRYLGIHELEPIIGTVENPKDPEFFIASKPKQKPRPPCPDQAWIRPKTRYRDERFHGDRIEVAMNILEQSDSRFLSFVTVVTTIQTTYHAAIDAALKDGKELASMIRRRVPGAVFILFPEVDIYLAKDIPASLMPDPSWKKGINPNQYVFKVHFHAVMFLPGIETADVEALFQRTPNGKRSTKYSGCNQVRAIKLYDVDRDGVIVPDVRGCVGYSRKNHYRPPVTERMLEGLPEWLLIQDAIVNNPKMIHIGGVRKTLTAMRSGHNAKVSNNSESVQISEIDSGLIESPESVDHPAYSNTSILNSRVVSVCWSWAICQGKKLGVFLKRFIVGDRHETESLTEEQMVVGRSVQKRHGRNLIRQE